MDIRMVTVEIGVAAPTSTPTPPGFEAVFAHFFFSEKHLNLLYLYTS